MSEEIEYRPRPDLLKTKLDCPSCRLPLNIVQAEEVDREIWFDCECPFCGINTATSFDPGDEPPDPCFTLVTLPLEAQLRGLMIH